MNDTTQTRHRWLDRPQTVLLRKALFQVHLWLGIGTGLYVVLISVTGSAAVFRRDLARWLLTDADSGSFPTAMRIMEWFVDLHDNLLSGPAGRTINGVAAILVLALLLTGAVVWWPGKRRWRKSLTVPRPSLSRRFFWRLHSALGFWSFSLLLLWTLTGIYFAFPGPIEALIDYFDPNQTDFDRPGEALLREVIRLHFGRFGGLGVRVTWVVLGLLPAMLFVSGFIVWWRRIRRKPGYHASQA